jgi:hypothetical protein
VQGVVTAAVLSGLKSSVLAVSTGVLLLAGCTKTEEKEPPCEPGESAPCVCESGKSGSKFCTSDQTFARCRCEGLIDVPICGDGVVEGDEKCDGDDLGGESCESLGYGYGTLACHPTACLFVTEGCRYGYPDGGGIVELDGAGSGPEEMPGPWIDISADGGAAWQADTVVDLGCPPWGTYLSHISGGEWPRILGPCPYWVRFPERLTAEALGEGYEFLRMGGTAILARQTTAQGTEPVLLHYAASLSPPPDPWSQVRLEDRSRALDLVGVDIYDSSALLLCGESSCSLYFDSQPGETGSRFTLEPVPGGLVPLAPEEIRGLGEAPLSPDCHQQIAVFGDGVYAFCISDMRWTAIVPPGSGSYFNALSSSHFPGFTTGELGIAVGDGGRIAVLHGDGGWSELDSGTQADLHSVLFDGESFIAAGQGGVIVVGTAEAALPCTPESATVVGFHGDLDHFGWQLAGVTADGDIFYGQSDRDSAHPGTQSWCRKPLGETVLDTSSWLCGIAANYWILTPDAVYGDTDCAID